MRYNQATLYHLVLRNYNSFESFPGIYPQFFLLCFQFMNQVFHSFIYSASFLSLATVPAQLRPRHLGGYKGSLFPVWQGFTIYFGRQEKKRKEGRKKGGREGGRKYGRGEKESGQNICLKVQKETHVKPVKQNL